MIQHRAPNFSTNVAIKFIQMSKRRPYTGPIGGAPEDDIQNFDQEIEERIVEYLALRLIQTQ